MTINTVTEDFAYFKARAGCKLNYIPHDCTEWSYSRPRRPVDEPCLPVDGAFARLCLHDSFARPASHTHPRVLCDDCLSAAREPSPLCGLTTWTDRIRVFDEQGRQLEVSCFNARVVI